MVFGQSFEPGTGGFGDGALPAGHSRRLRVLFWSFLGGLLAISAGLLRVHMNPDSRLTREELSHIGEVELRVPRGEIRDRDGRLFAKDRRVYSLWADPRAIVEPEMTALCLASMLNIPEDELQSRLAPRDENGSVKKFVWAKRWLSESDLDAFEHMDPMLARGLALKEEWVRYYPEGELAAHVIGFVNREGYGCEGIEMAFDKRLRCTPGKRRTRVDARRRVLESLTLEYVEEEGGEHVCLTLDKAIQRNLEQALDRALVDCKAPRGMGLVMDPKTGAILAMACRPAYDPNAFWAVQPEDYKNRAVTDVFEPGSAFKIVTVASALDRALITPSMRIDCENGAFNPYGHRIRDFHKLGVEPLTKCFAESSNIATIKIAAMLTPEGLEEAVRRFGFGQKTCPDFVTESRGITHPRSAWSRLTMGAIPIGQEIAVTMPQLARAFCVVANGGELVTPYLVEQVVDRNGDVTYQHEAQRGERVIAEATAATMRELCHLVVIHGTGTAASIPEFRVGGKTGTAQIARPDGRGFYPDKYTTIFAGFAPVSDPRLCAVIIVQEPAIRLHYGGYVCGPVFREVVRNALIRMNCPLDPVREEVTGEAAGDEDADTVLAREELELTAPPLKTADILDGLELVALDSTLASDEPTLPSFLGMTKRQVKSSLDALRLRWDAQGAGRVVAQDPPAGTPLREVTLCRLVFSNEPATKETHDTRRPARASRL